VTVETPDVYSHANPIFVREIVSRGAMPVVLDVGCWNGTLGRTLIRECGANGYRVVDVADLDREMPDAGGRSYDFILFGDVLEHLVHSSTALADISRRLKPGGSVLVSLPNIAFVGNRLSHLFGRWNYGDYGILDRTHLRFFTKQTMIELLEGVDLHVMRVDGYVGLHRHPWIVREPLRFLGRVWPSLFAIQIVLSACARETPSFTSHQG